MTASSNSSQSTHPIGQVLWEELLALADERIFCPLKKIENVVLYTFYTGTRNIKEAREKRARCQI